MGVIDREQQGRQPGDPGGSEHASVEQCGHYHDGAQPRQRMQVHERWKLRSDLVVDPVGKARQRSEKRERQLLMGPPR